MLVRCFLATITGFGVPRLPRKTGGVRKIGLLDVTSLVFFLAGKRVKNSVSRLRSDYLSPSQTVLVTCFKQNQLVGHAFATVWNTSIGKKRLSFSSPSHLTNIQN